MHCPQCHKEIADTAKFCPECGTRISGLSGGLFDDNVCPSCHMRNRDGVKFCVSCGAGLTCLCPECECEHPVHRPFCGRCGTEVKAFLSVRDSAQKMRAYSNDNKWSRVANEYGHVPKNARLPGGKGQELLAEISALNEAAKTALQQRDEQLSTMATAIKAALQRREELLTAMATAMEKHNYAAAAQAVTECLDIFPANATATEVRKQLDQLAKRVTATAAELENTKEFCDWTSGKISCPPGGEDSKEFTKRICLGLNRMIREMMKNDIYDAAAVIHGGVIMTLFAAAGMPRHKAIEWTCEYGKGYTALITPSLYAKSGIIEIIDTVPSLEK